MDTSGHGRWLAVTVAIAVGAGMISPAFGAPTQPSPSAVRCGSIAFAPQSDNLAFDIQGNRVSCSTARAVAGASRPQSLRPGRDRHYRADRFTCRGRLVEPGGKYYEHYVCLRAGATVEFNRG